LLKPKLDALEWIVCSGGVEENESEIGVVDEEGVDESVVRLSSQVPKNRLALSAVCSLSRQLGHEPELLAMRGGVLSELAMG